MVHALNEAWRVLVPCGSMIDVRPLSVVIPLEVVYEGGSELAGMADMTPDVQCDIGADQVIEKVVRDGYYTQASLEIFDYAYYWKTFHGMVGYFEERWQGEIIVAKEVLEKASKIYWQKRPNAQLRLPLRMKLGKYVKLG